MPQSTTATPSVAVSYDPSLPKFRGPYLVENHHSIYLPLKISGNPKGAMLITKGYDLKLIDAHGEVYREHNDNMRTPIPFSGGHDDGDGNEMPYFPQTTGREILTHQLLPIPLSVYRRITGRPVQIQVSYEFVLLIGAPKSVIGLAAGSRATIANIGSCISDGYDGRGAVVIRCSDAKKSPECISALVENIRTGKHNSDAAECWLGSRIMNREGLVVGIPERPERGYPVTTSQVGQARLVVTTYTLGEYVTITVTSPFLSLSDLDPICEKPTVRNNEAPDYYARCLVAYGHGPARRPAPER